MKRCRIICILIILLINRIPVYGSGIGIIKVTGSNKYKSIALSSDVYNNSKEDLSDLRIINKANKQIPYFINSHNTLFQEVEKEYELKSINYFRDELNTYEDFEIANTHISGYDMQDIQANSLHLDTDVVMFAKDIELYGSHDGLGWSKLVSDNLYRVNTDSKLYINFNNMYKYTYYRIKILNSVEGIRFNKAKLVYNSSEVTQEKFSRSMNTKYSVETKDKQTIVTITGMRNIRLKDLQFKTNSQFKRFVTCNTLNISQTLYNLTFDETKYSNLLFSLNGLHSNTDSIILTIENGDDEPLSIEAIICTYYVDELIFSSEDNDTYTLTFDRESNEYFPQYDIVNYKDFILAGEIDECTLDNFTINEVQEVSEVSYKVAFNIFVIIVVIALLVVVINSLRRT